MVRALLNLILNVYSILFCNQIAVDRFPVLERDRETNTNSIERSRSQTAASGNNVKLQDHNHNREVIFALPSLRLHFKTEHIQGVSTPDASGKDSIRVLNCFFQVYCEIN